MKDQEQLIAWFNFPEEHRDRIRSPIGSISASIRHRTAQTKTTLSKTTAKLKVFELVIAAAKAWSCLKGDRPLPKVVTDFTHIDSVRPVKQSGTSPPKSQSSKFSYNPSTITL